MLINYDSIKTASDAAQAIDDNFKARISCLEAIANTPVVSRATKKTGTITDISKDSLFLNFESWSSVPISVDSYREIIETDETTNSLIGRYLQTFAEERKLNRLIIKLSKA